MEIIAIENSVLVFALTKTIIIIIIIVVLATWNPKYLALTVKNFDVLTNS
jgi:hypothetical protein